MKILKKHCSMFVIVFVILFGIQNKLNSREPDCRSSYPFLTPHTLMNFCSVVFDEDTNRLNKRVQEGDVVFVRTDKLQIFFQYIHPRIRCNYILLTHYHDNLAPGNFAYYLDDSNIIAWFAANTDGYTHPKLHPIPLGITNRCFEHGNVEIIEEVLKIRDTIPKSILLYMNFSQQNDPERSIVYNLFKDKPYCKVQVRTTAQEKHRLSTKEYFYDLASSKFVLSPRGYGLDCYRTWESLLMGAIPIVKSSSIDSLYEDLPVLIVRDWDEINLEFLNMKWEEMRKKQYKMEKIYADYWFNLINSCKNHTMLNGR